MDAKVADRPTVPDFSRQPGEEHAWRPRGCGRIALIFQGGGALGAYQAGVYQALSEAGIEPDWVTGVSIGGINAAIIAGNKPGQRTAKLKEFWRRITDRRVWAYTPDGDIYRQLRNMTSAMMTMSQGQPGFFKPHKANAWFSPAGAATATSFYDCEPLRETLLDLVDFSLINQRVKRFSVGAVNVLTGNFIYFDNRDEEIGPEHVMASGALPPAFPMVKIGTDYYWDGGIVSNTPLQHLLDQEDNANSLVFQVDLFSARGALPRDIQDVMARHKDIMYSSRTRYNTDVYRKTYNLRTALHNAALRGAVPDTRSRSHARRTQAQGRAQQSSTVHDHAAHLSAEVVRRSRKGLRVLGDVDARALAERI